MGDQQYGLPVLRHLMAAGTTNFQGNPQSTADPFFAQSRNFAPPPPPTTTLQTHHFESIMSGCGELTLPSGFVKLGHHHHHDHYCTTNNNPANIVTSSSAAHVANGGSFLYGVEMESGSGNNSRWPRQETLTLLEIRSRLDSRFKEANQKGPLWDEVSRIMAEEHGYQRSGKKCREKFENLYKYYKKTREGKAGRQDGKHYRFFRQLEALYGETSNQNNSAPESHLLNNPLLYQTSSSNAINQENQETLQESKRSESLSFSNTSEFETSSSENNDDDLSAIAYMMNRSMEKQKGRNESQSYNTKGKNRWKTKVKDFVDSQMRKLMDTQEAWMERMLKTIEDREQERMSREEEWKKQEVARFDREHEFWAKERAWIEARDAALMETMKKYAGTKGELLSAIEQIAISTQSHNKTRDSNIKKILNEEINNIRWCESEILSLIQLKSTLEQRFQESGYSKEGLWEEIAAKMANLGYDRSVEECQEKWENMNIYFNMMDTECHKKRKEDLRTNNYFQQVESYSGQEIAKQRLENMNSASHHSYVDCHHQMEGSFFQVGVNEGEHLWNKYGLNLSNDKN